MFKGLSITKCERITAGMMTPLLDGGYTEVDFTGFAWRCDGCGLVWTRQHQAVNCAKRGHVSSYESEVYGVRRVENGQPIGDLHTYTRSAMRRDPVAPARSPELIGAFKSVCLCGHTGDGRGGQHAGELGHGHCMMAGCSCAKFTWLRFIEPKAAV